MTGSSPDADLESPVLVGEGNTLSGRVLATTGQQEEAFFNHWASEAGAQHEATGTTVAQVQQTGIVFRFNLNNQESCS